MDPYQPPESRIEPAIELAKTQTQTLASRWSRLLAAIVDGFILTLIWAGLDYLYFYVTDEQTVPWYTEESSILVDILITLLVFILNTILYLIINGHYLAHSGQTIGKKLLGIQVVDYRSGVLLKLSDLIFKRYIPQQGIIYAPVVGPFFSLVNLLFIFGDEKRCVHDMIARTKVVRLNF